MAKRLTKIITMGVLIIMALGLFSGCGSNYIYKEGDFKLTIEVDKTEASVGDTITVMAKFENLSEQDIRIQMSHTQHKKLEDMILIGIFEANEEHIFNVTSKGGPLKKFTINKGETVIRIMNLEIRDNLVNELVANAMFNTGKGYEDIVSICSEIHQIIIKENN